MKKFLLFFIFLPVALFSGGCGAELAGCLIQWPSKGEIVFDSILPPQGLEGKIYFIGIQMFKGQYEYNGSQDYLYDAYTIFSTKTYDLYLDKKILSSFIESLDLPLQEKLKIKARYSNFAYTYRPWQYSDYSSFWNQREVVNDELSCIDYWSFHPYKDGVQGKMTSGFVSSLAKKHNDADYFFLVAIRPLKISAPDYDRKSHSYSVALITVIFNRDGKKVYSKIYEENIDVPDKKGTTPYYDCTLKLLENQGAQISKDLFFLLSADDAPSPNLADLYNELQRTDSKSYFPIKDALDSLEKRYKGK
jgi:hypothetical protein